MVQQVSRLHSNKIKEFNPERPASVPVSRYLFPEQTYGMFTESYQSLMQIVQLDKAVFDRFNQLKEFFPAIGAVLLKSN